MNYSNKSILLLYSSFLLASIFLFTFSSTIVVVVKSKEVVSATSNNLLDSSSYIVELPVEVKVRRYNNLNKVARKYNHLKEGILTMKHVDRKEEKVTAKRKDTITPFVVLAGLSTFIIAISVTFIIYYYRLKNHNNKIAEKLH